jgi:hypothetical protein
MDDQDEGAAAPFILPQTNLKKIAQSQNQQLKIKILMMVFCFVFQ